MAEMPQGFDASKEEKAAYTPLPAGLYVVAVVDSKRKPNSKGTGVYLEFVLEVLDGPYQGRRLWDRLNVENPNEMAVRIARAQLASLCLAVGLTTARDTSELHNRPLRIEVGQRVGPDGRTYNETKGYQALSAAVAPTAPPPPVAAAAGSIPPWKRP